MAACKACMAALVWITTPAGKSIPCDATPRYYIEKPAKATGVGYVPHWATCPYADRFKNGGRK